MMIFHCYVSSPEGKPRWTNWTRALGIWDKFDNLILLWNQPQWSCSLSLIENVTVWSQPKIITGVERVILKKTTKQSMYHFQAHCSAKNHHDLQGKLFEFSFVPVVYSQWTICTNKRGMSICGIAYTPYMVNIHQNTFARCTHLENGTKTHTKPQIVVRINFAKICQHSVCFSSSMLPITWLVNITS